MTNRKTTRRALVMSLLSLLLCCSMLVGTTFAWFTDSVTSGKNKIVAGNLDVELYYKLNANDQWAKVTSETELFDDAALWEPGYTQVVYLKVANEGTLALKYQLGVNIISETQGKNVDNEMFKLSDYIKFDAIETAEEKFYADRDEARKAVTDPQIISAGYGKASKLLAAEEGKESAEYVTLVVYMPEETDNKANYREVKPEITLGVNLVATQLAYENDSFGPEYDKGAVYADKTYTVEDEAATLADTLTEINAANDKTVLVQLNKPVEWETGAGIGSTPVVDENAAVQDLIIDANGQTFTATGDGVGNIGMANGGTLTIKNAKIVDQSVSYAENSWEYGYLEFDGNLVFENCEFVNAVMIEGENAEFVNCTFNSNADNEYAVWVANGNASFKNCTFTGPRGLKTHEQYGTDVGTILVNNCTFDNITKKPGIAIGTVNANTTVTVKNSDFINCQAGDQGKYIYETDTDVTTFNFNVSENNEVIKSVTPDLVISTKEELFAFANDVNVNGNSYSGKLIVLDADINLNNEEWTPVGQTGGNGAATYFCGMFDGKGHTISNLKITDNVYDEGNNYAAGLFGFVDAGDAQIVNLNVAGANVSAHHWTGVIAGYLTGKISNCTVTNATVTCTHANEDACGDKAGVIVGYVNQGNVSACTVKDSTVTAGRDAGQIAGCTSPNGSVDDTCTAYNVTVTAGGDCTGANIKNELVGRINK